MIENRNLFTDLNAYDLVFASSVNGKPERRAVLRADCALGKTVHIAFPFTLPEEGLACMTVTAVQRAMKPLLDRYGTTTSPPGSPLPRRNWWQWTATSE